jgi:hypothetical protein
MHVYVVKNLRMLPSREKIHRFLANPIPQKASPFHSDFWVNGTRVTKSIRNARRCAADQRLLRRPNNILSLFRNFYGRVRGTFSVNALTADAAGGRQIKSTLKSCSPYYSDAYSLLFDLALFTSHQWRRSASNTVFGISKSSKFQ